MVYENILIGVLIGFIFLLFYFFILILINKLKLRRLKNGYIEEEDKSRSKEDFEGAGGRRGIRESREGLGEIYRTDTSDSKLSLSDSASERETDKSLGDSKRSPKRNWTEFS